LVVVDPIFHEEELRAFTRRPSANHLTDQSQQDDYTINENDDDGMLTYYRGDIRNTTLSNEIFSHPTRKISGVINLAAVSRVLWCLENQADCTAVNVDAVAGLLDALPGSSAWTERASVEGSKNADGGRLPWFIQASSREVYGDTRPGEYITESSATVPSNVYGQSKLSAEHAIQAFIDREKEKTAAKGTLQAIALRLSNVYGGEFDHRERLVPAMMTQAIAHRTIQLVGGDQFVSPGGGFRSQCWYKRDLFELTKSHTVPLRP
jgi:dTDP-D-glucose 4,6-dehydratase